MAMTRLSPSVWALGVCALVGHLVVARNYGYFRDELYYIAAGRHLDLGYVDFPAMVALQAFLVEHTLGLSLLAIHLLPALAHAAIVVLTGLLARRLGAGSFGQGLAALGSLVLLAFLASGSIFSMDILDALWWVLGTYVLAGLLATGDRRGWLLFGLVAGLGLLTKMTMLFFGFAIVVGFVLTPERKYLGSRWLWLGGIIAVMGLAPYVVWNAGHGWPTLAFWANYGGKLAPGGPVSFLSQQLVTMNPLVLPLVVSGLVFLFRGSGGRPYRALGWTFVVLAILFAATQAKAYFLSPAYPILFAAGAMAIERWTAKSRRWVRPGYAAVLAAAGLALAPVAMPILPPPTFGRIYRFLGSDAGVHLENQRTAVLPQWLADRFGWEGMVATIARVDAQLPPAERSQTCIVTDNYGEAGAVDFFGPTLGLPRAMSGHNNYWIWGPAGCTGAVVISVGIPRDQLETIFAQVQQAATVTCDYCMPYEDNLPVYVCRQPKLPMTDVWLRTRHFN